MVRGFFLTLYCVALAFGTWWIVRQQKLAVPEFVASRELPLDRWLRPGDVAAASWLGRQTAALTDGPDASSFAGRYVTGEIPKGAALRLEATGAVPLLAAREGHLTLLVTLPRAKLGELNAGGCARLSLKESKPFGVRAVLCPLSQAADCTAAIDVPAARLTEINGAAALAVEAEAPCP